MASELSPFVEANYGWPYGSAGWNTEMDANLVKFSYLHDRNIDAIVASLPAIADGTAYFNTADNRLYFDAEGVRYSSPTPKWFEVTLRASGEVYQFDGSALTLKMNLSELATAINNDPAYHTTVDTALGTKVDTTDFDDAVDIIDASIATKVSTVDLADPTDPSKGAGMVGRKRSALSASVSKLSQFLNAQWVNIWEFDYLVTVKPNPADPNTWDWTPALQAAADSIAPNTANSGGMETPPAKGGVVYLPTGDYGITKYIWRSYVTIVGEASSNTFIIPFTGATGFLFDLQGTYDRPRGVGARYFTIAPNRNVSIDAGAGKSPVSALNIQGFEKQCSIRDVKIVNLTGTGIKSGDTQDMVIDDVEMRFLGMPLDIDARAVSDGGVVNRTNAVRFTNCRLENSGASSLQGLREIEFIGCKFEQSILNIVNPHGLDFIGCMWALGTSFAVNVSGFHRGIQFIGGSTDTGLAVGTGANTAKFITSTLALNLVSMSFRGHGPNAIDGECTAVDCLFDESDRPYVIGGGSTKFRGNNDANVTNGTGSLAPYNRTPVASYEVSTGTLTKTPTFNVWYQNNTMQTMELFLSMPYTTTSLASNFQVKKRHDSGAEYVVGSIQHPVLSGSGVDILTLTLLPGESYWHNRSGGSTAASLMAFYR
jgi:hypothetical protein